MPRAVATALFLGFVATSARAQTPYTARIDSLFGQFPANAPGCAVGVMQNGVLAYARGYGTANLDYGIPLNSKSVFYLASVSKQFTAAAIALAAAEGKLRLDEEVRKYIPELPDYGTPITIRQLVHHTSGVRDYLTLISLAGRHANDEWTDRALLELITRQRALNFAPGSEHLYSNTGYILLAEIIRRATGSSLREYARTRIFEPLGMHDTHFHDDAREVVPRRVIGYMGDGSGRWRINHWFNFDKVGDGGAYSTIEDMARWEANFHSGRVGGAALLQQLQQRGVLTTGDTTPYAFGLFERDYRGLRIVEHGGSLVGFRAHLLRVPSERFATIVLCNTPTAAVTQLARKVVDVYLTDRMGDGAATTNTTNTGAPSAIDDPPETAQPLADLIGSYWSDELEAAYRLEAEGGLLVLERTNARFNLRPRAVDTFVGGGLTLRFERTEGRVSGFILDAGRVRGIRFVRR